jgi:arylsulfatase A-like enzyme
VERRTFLKAAGGSALLWAGVAGAAQERSRPNVLLIITDQQHRDTIAARGCPHVRTPALDRLAGRGVTFIESHSPNPLCSPARSALLTGRTSSETGVYQNGRRIRPDIPNLGQWLAARAGYESVYAGKWHLPATHQETIEGFRVLTTAIGGVGILGDTATSRACEGYLRNRAGSRPFFMVASFMQPHDICEWLRLNTEVPERPRYGGLDEALPALPDNSAFDSAEPEIVKRKRSKDDPAIGGWTARQWRYYRWSYYRQVEMVDAEIGRILRTVDECGLARDTVVVFTSDHGEGLGHHGMVRKNSPYEEALTVPLIVSFPGRSREGATDAAHLVSSLDVVPTVCDYAGVPAPPSMRGRSLRPLLEGRSAPWHPFIVSEINGNRLRVVRTKRYKYVKSVGDPVEQLFDMQADRGETRNLAAAGRHAAVLEEHRRLLVEWERRLDAAPGVPHTAAWRQRG